MLGFIGIAILAGRLFPPEDPGFVTILYWIGVSLLVLWMALLALADMIATRVHFGVQRRKVEFERQKLRAQLKRLQSLSPDDPADPPQDETDAKSGGHNIPD